MLRVLRRRSTAVKARGAADSEPGALLLRCLSARGPETGDRGLETAAWSRVVELATREHVAPLLFKRLKESGGSDLVPADEWKRLRLAYFTNGDRNTRLFRELRKVLDCLHNSDIKVIVLKGAYLAEAVYGDTALRPMCDADLLVRQAELAKAESALLAISTTPPQAYRPPPPSGETGPANAEGDGGMEKHIQQIQIHDLTVELHWSIASEAEPFKINANGLWQRACPARVAGVEALALSSEDLILHLCLNLCHTDWLAGLRSLCDLAETVRRFGSSTDWAGVAQGARDWDAAKYVGLTLSLAQTLLGAEVPGSIIEQLVPGGLDPRVLEAAKESVVTQTGYGPRIPSLYPSGAKSLRGEVKWFWRRVFLSRDEMAAKYPASRNSRHLYLHHALRLRDALRASPSYLPILVRFMRAGLRRSRYASLSSWLKSGKT
ncbi:nucleotidyltransferase family protein [candidate division WOR-3 bacterium]|nr:nucleotidyltransferase family protein [candidate division WOR-3 bacterium]